MNINLASFQLSAIKRLFECMAGEKRDIILKAPTGSGKTIILTHFMSEWCRENAKTIFVWLTPGKGDLEEQSKTKMDKYIHNAQTKLLSDIMTGGFCENDACFVNWEKLTKKGNAALKDSERTNFLEWVDKALREGLSFKVIIDESHQNFTAKSDEIVKLFKADKIIRASATPLADKNAAVVEISDAEAIAEGLIKKLIVINENFPQKVEAENPTHYLLERAIEKRTEIASALAKIGAKVNPLVIVQLPNKSENLFKTCEEFFEKREIAAENGLLAVWLSDDHRNTEGIEQNDALPQFVIMKQAVATGWDCPRAYILVKLRENMDETFETQTVGRIRRMAEAKHYGDDLLDNCYIYTFDEKWTSGVKAALGKNALDAKKIFLKKEYYGVKLTKEQRTMVTNLRDARKARQAIASHFKNRFSLTGDKNKNRAKLEANEFNFSENIERNFATGEVRTIESLKSDELNSGTLVGKFGTHEMGRAFQHSIGVIGMEIGQTHEKMAGIIRAFFSDGDKNHFRDKILSLEPRPLYAFVINNEDLLRRSFRDAMSANSIPQASNFVGNVSESDFFIPRDCLFTYDGNAKIQDECEKNAYLGYLHSAQPRSSSEKKFEKFCEECENVDWWHKNGDKGREYFSIVYADNAATQKLFYPDYILSVRGEIWICETKGGFDKSGASEDIDRFSPKKFEVLKNYLTKHNLKGGFVRCDRESEELFICTENYSDDISSKSWQRLKDVFAQKFSYRIPKEEMLCVAENISKH